MTIAQQLRDLRDGDYLLAPNETNMRQKLLTIASQPSVNIIIETTLLNLNGKEWLHVKRVSKEKKERIIDELLELNAEQIKYLHQNKNNNNQ